MAYPHCWFRDNAGNWYGTAAGANPATDTNGIDISGIAPIFPVYCGRNTFSGSVGTINTGATSFFNTAPAGSKGWGGTWNPADETGGSLSNGNLTWTCGGISNGGVRGTVSSSTLAGLYYFEINISGPDIKAPGLADAGAALSTNIGLAGGAIALQGTSIYYQNVLINTMTSVNSGDYIGIALLTAPLSLGDSNFFFGS